jgi:hypothetical protein
MPPLTPLFHHRYQAGSHCHAAVAAAALPLRWGVQVQNSKESKL